MRFLISGNMTNRTKYSYSTNTSISCNIIENCFYKLSKRKLNIFWRNIFLIVWKWNAMSWTSCVNKSWYAIMRGVALVTIYRCIRFQRRRMCQTWYIHLLTCHKISLVVLEYMCGLWVEYHYNVPKMSDQIIISYG